MTWPDIVILALAVLAALKGFKRGFIGELAGAVALIAALLLPWFYNGAFDGAIDALTHIGRAPSHVVAIIGIGVATYIAVLIVARLFSALARAPVIGTLNAVAGAGISLLKLALFLWLLLYVALFFPMPGDVRHDLHRSRGVALLTQPNRMVDDKLIATLPSFARPYVQPFFVRHRV